MILLSVRQINFRGQDLSSTAPMKQYDIAALRTHDSYYTTLSSNGWSPKCTERFTLFRLELIC